MECFSGIGRFFKRYSLTFNILTNIAWAIVCLICYALLVILFLRPAWLQLDSLVFVRDSQLSPTVAIGLITVLLSGSTATLVTRAAEHSLWLKLVPQESNHRLTVSETRRQAQWSVSAWERLKYFFTGDSWLLKFGGMFLFATAAVNPVLLAGITPTQDASNSTETTLRSGEMFAGFLDPGNSAYNGGQWKDVPMSIAALASMSNLSAPGSALCGDDGCSISATMASIQAECVPYTMGNPERIGTISNSILQPYPFCSTLRPDLCLNLVTSNPNTYANFTSAPPTESCLNGRPADDSWDVICPGEWATIFGVWTNTVDGSADQEYPVHAVDCRLRYGNVSVLESSTSAPEIIPDSFVQSQWALRGSSAFQWHRLYTEDYPIQISNEPGNTPYSFVGVSVATGSNSIYSSPVGSLLLNYGGPEGYDASTVAEMIRKNFEMSTLFAFSRDPASADVTVTATTVVQMWRYDSVMLSILAVPLLATLLVVLGKWRVGSAEDVVGYDPVEIARRGPLLREGVDGEYGGVMGYDSDEEGTREVWAVKRDSGRGMTVRTRFMTE